MFDWIEPAIIHAKNSNQLAAKTCIDFLQELP